MKQYFSLPMIWYYCLMERKMIYDDFHSFMLFYFLCLLLTHLILFHIFLPLLLLEEKSLFSLSIPPTLLPAWQHFCIYTRKLIYEKFLFWWKKKKRGGKFNHRQNYFSWENSFCELLDERFIWSQKFPQIMQFSATINHFKPETWTNEYIITSCEMIKERQKHRWKIINFHVCDIKFSFNQLQLKCISNNCDQITSFTFSSCELSNRLEKEKVGTHVEEFLLSGSIFRALRMKIIMWI